MKWELLAPAGDLERLKTAVVYGADAVYFGGKQFSLRARASNFTLENIRDGALFAHQHGSRVYVTVNIIPHNSDFEGLAEYLKVLEELQVDAIICASPAIMDICREAAPKLEVHISTQQTTLNSAALDFWQQRGADRIVLGREATLDQIATISRKVEVPLEVFIHGGMCASYSGRCVISNLLTNRDANRGGCAQSCRWNYHLWHENQLLDREEFLFSMGSKDMCTAECIEEILALQPASLKIEGRMKTAFYLGCVIKGYRYLIDCYRQQGFITPQQHAYGEGLIALASNRDSFPGFYHGLCGRQGQMYNTVSTASQLFVANVKEYDPDSGVAVVEVRNNFRAGQTLAVLNPWGEEVTFTAERLVDMEDNEVAVANKPMQLLKIHIPVAADSYSFIYTPEEQL